MDLQALKTEISTDPLGLGYAGKSDEDVSRLISQLNRPVDKLSLDAGLLMSCLAEADYNALPTRGQKYWDLLIAAGSIPVTQLVKQSLLALFDNNTQTRRNLVAAIRQQGSRAEELGLGRVTPSDVANARRLP